MTRTRTHTYALMDVSSATYREVKRKLLDAEYGHAVTRDGRLDMHGIALVQEEPPPAPPRSGAAGAAPGREESE